MSINEAVGDYLVRANDLYRDVKPKNSPMNDRTIVMIEGRDCYWTQKVLRLASMYLGPTWNVRLYETPNGVKTNNRLYTDWDIERVTVPMKNITREHYSCLLKTKEFWAGIPEEHILILHTDSLLIRALPDETLHWDIMGAPCGDEFLVMNGGTSLRRRSAMLRVLEEHAEEFAKNPEEPEDVTFSRVMRADPSFRVPSVEENAKYFFESSWPPSPDVCGIHATTKTWVSSDQYRILLKNNRF